MIRRILASLLFLVLASIPAMPQKTAAIKKFSSTTDHIPGAERRNDLNGTPCALVKIQVVDDIERIEGNKIGSIVNKGVEKWVYMCKGSRNMKVHLKNHLPVMVMFRDYDIVGLESNRVYELVLELPTVETSTSAVPSSNVVVKQKLTINYEPVEATVLIDSKLYTGNGKIETILPVGEHDYIIAATGYATVEGTVKLNNNAPRVITEVLSKDQSHVNTSRTITNHNNNVVTDGNVGSRVSLNSVEVTNEDSKVAVQRTERMLPPQAIDGEFKYPFDGIIFICKAQKGYITIISFDTNATDIVIPSTVYYKGNYYPVRTIGSNLGGNHYSVERIVIQDGVEIIEKSAFSDFRNLKDVKIPKSVVEIGKKAFRYVHNVKFNLPANISEMKLRMGDAIKIM